MISNRYPDAATYKSLYQRFYEERSVEDLLALGGPISGMDVLDLCGGDGRLALAAVEHRARIVTLVDQEPDMTIDRSRIRTQYCSAEEFLRSANHDDVKMRFDRIFCQQGVNYWLNEETIGQVAKVLRPGGLFVFNTFNRRPSEKPVIRQYDLDGKSFVEVSWLVDEVVYHAQIREGMPPHTTAFRWLSPRYLMDTILPFFFSFTVERQGGTSLYRCEKK